MTTTTHPTAHAKAPDKAHDKAQDKVQASSTAAVHEDHRTWQDEYFTLVKRIEAPVLRTTERLADRVAGFVPVRPAFLAQMPTAHDLRAAVVSGLAFRKKMVDEQTVFARRMMKALDPVLERLDTVPAATAPTTRTFAKVKAAKEAVVRERSAA